MIILKAAEYKINKINAWYIINENNKKYKIDSYEE